METIPLHELGAESENLRAERSDAAANRILILETAERLFAKQGVASVSMADIAAAAQVGKGTLYRRYANKAELCLALMDVQMTDFQDGALEKMREQTALGYSNLEQLGAFLDDLVYFTDRHLPLLCEVQRAGLLARMDHAQAPHFWQHMTLSGLLQAAQRGGELSEDLDVAFLGDALLASLHGDLFQFQRLVRGFSLQRISSGLRSLVMPPS